MQKEINKHLKRINVEKLNNNHKGCIELYNLVGSLYSEIESYDEAVHYHEQALEASKLIGDRHNTAMAFRFIGEAKASMGQFYQAIDSTKKYLELAQKTNDKVEIQRAHTTLGRVYLMQAQDMKARDDVDDSTVKQVAEEAEKRFQTALNLAESVREQVGEKEFAQMNSGLLINIGLLKDISEQHGESVLRFNRAIEICKKAKLKEDLFRCQNILTGIFRQRNNVKMAVRTSEDALLTAKQVGKKLLICDAYIEKGLVKIFQRDFKSAKRMFAQAYLEKSPNEEDHAKAIKLTKLAHLISQTYDKLAQGDISDVTRMKLSDKLGDLFVAVNSFKLAVEFYRRAFTAAKVCCQSKIELARILYSMAETYADDKQYEHALACYEKELVYRNGNNTEQCQTLIKIAHMREYLNQSPDKVCEGYEKALDKAGKTPKLMYNVLKDYVAYMKRKSFNASRCKQLDNDLLNLKSYPEVVEEMEKEGDEELVELEDEIADVDDIITDDEDNDEVLMVGRRRSKGTKKFKANEVGDTPLHEACIKGDLKRVKSLISQGHDINPRDNAGWTPLHEASNHGHVEIVEHLIENGADVSNRGFKGMSPLHDAATNGHFDIMRLLINNGANVIALTDTGETILNCLRDFKNRNYPKMSNRNLSEYKQMEAELLNIMDKCGFNLMEAGIKNLGNRKDSSLMVEDAPQEKVSSKPKDRLNVLDSNPMTNSVREYKDVIGTLKRKRLIEEPEEAPGKADLPATYKTGLSTSASTKEWLIDDVSRENRLLKKRGSNLKDLMESEDEFSDDDFGYIESRSKQLFTGERHSKNTSSSDPTLIRSKPTKNGHRKDVLDSDDEVVIEEENLLNRNGHRDSDDIIMVDQLPKRSPELPESPRPPASPIFDIDDFAPLTSPRLNNIRSESSMSVSNPFSSKPPFSLSAQPLVVEIEDRKLLIPIKEEWLREKATIKWLKETIIERYSTLVDAKPIISLTPASDPLCQLFDGDMCQDVINENVVARIESWQLDPIEESYVKNCASSKLSPLDHIKIELRRIKGNKLDLSYARFPQSHIKPIVGALNHRDFVQANLTGSAMLLPESFYCSHQVDMLNTIMSWRKLSSLTLRCVGLTRSHFEILCSQMKLAALRTLDLSFNCIVYKCKEEFKKQVGSLRKNCINLKRLNMRKNQLQFVAAICNKTPASSELNLAEELGFATIMQSTANKPTAAEQPQDLEIMGSEQNEYSVYSA